MVGCLAWPKYTPACAMPSRAYIRDMKKLEICAGGVVENASGHLLIVATDRPNKKETVRTWSWPKGHWEEADGNPAIMKKILEGKNGSRREWIKKLMEDEHEELMQVLLATATREIYEESGVTDLDYANRHWTHERISHHDENVQKSITLFHFKTQQVIHRSRKPERHPVSAWVQPSDVAALLHHPADKQFYMDVMKPDLQSEEVY